MSETGVNVDERRDFARKLLDSFQNSCWNSLRRLLRVPSVNGMETAKDFDDTLEPIGTSSIESNCAETLLAGKGHMNIFNGEDGVLVENSKSPVLKATEIRDKPVVSDDNIVEESDIEC